MNGDSPSDPRFAVLPVLREDLPDPTLHVNPAYVTAILGYGGPTGGCLLHTADGKQYSIDMPADLVRRRLLQAE